MTVYEPRGMQRLGSRPGDGLDPNSAVSPVAWCSASEKDEHSSQQCPFSRGHHGHLLLALLPNHRAGQRYAVMDGRAWDHPLCP